MEILGHQNCCHFNSAKQKPNEILLFIQLLVKRLFGLWYSFSMTHAVCSPTSMFTLHVPVIKILSVSLSIRNEALKQLCNTALNISDKSAFIWMANLVNIRILTPLRRIPPFGIAQIETVYMIDLISHWLQWPSFSFPDTISLRISFCFYIWRTYSVARILFFI